MPTDTPLHETTSFPRLYARTLRFTLGVPRALTVTADGSRVLFLRTPSGTSRTGSLWAYDVHAGTERCLADPDVLLAGGEELSAAERSRRERSRESGAGVVAYATDATGAERPLVEPDGDNVVWGQAEFVAAEDMDRRRGYWWAPDGESLLVERYDETPVPVWYVSDPAPGGVGTRVDDRADRRQLAGVAGRHVAAPQPPGQREHRDGAGRVGGVGDDARTRLTAALAP